MRPGNSSGFGDSPGSRTGGVISGCGLPGGIPGGGSVGVPGVDGGISGGSIGIGITKISCQENDNDDAASMFPIAPLFRCVTDRFDVVAVGVQHEEETQMIDHRNLPGSSSARQERIAPRLARDRKAACDHVSDTISLPFVL